MFITKEETKTHNIYKIGKFKLCFRKNKSNNNIFVVDENGNKKRVSKIKGLKIKFGSNSTVTIHKPIANFKDCNIVCGNNTNIEIGSSKYTINKLKILAFANNMTCKIGKNFSCTNLCYLMLHKEENQTIQIGDNCMFGMNIMMRASDGHPIYQKGSKTLLNKAAGGGIFLGNNVWLGMNVSVLKNTKIADGCIIGASSVVIKDCLKPNSIYVGTPAKFIKDDVEWDREFEKINEE